MKATFTHWQDLDNRYAVVRIDDSDKDNREAAKLAHGDAVSLRKKSKSWYLVVYWDMENDELCSETFRSYAQASLFVEIGSEGGVCADVYTGKYPKGTPKSWRRMADRFDGYVPHMGKTMIYSAASKIHVKDSNL